MSSRRTIVERTIKLQNTGRTPVRILGPRIGLSDILTYDISLSKPDDPSVSEWGFERVRRPDGGWVVPTEPHLPTWEEVDAYQVPKPDLARRFARMPEARKAVGDRYCLARFGLSGHATYIALRGAVLGWEDCLRDTERFRELSEHIMNFETELFSSLKDLNFQGVEFTDMWSSIPGQMMRVPLWKRVLGDLYQQQIEAAQNFGLDVWFSIPKCDNYFFGVLVSLGVQVLTIEHTELTEVSKIENELHGKVCFATRVDKLYDKDDLEESERRIRDVYECLRAIDGGFIATIGANAKQDEIVGISQIVKKL